MHIFIVHFRSLERIMWSTSFHSLDVSFKIVCYDIFFPIFFSSSYNMYILTNKFSVFPIVHLLINGPAEEKRETRVALKERFPSSSSSQSLRCRYIFSFTNFQWQKTLIRVLLSEKRDSKSDVQSKLMACSIFLFIFSNQLELFHSFSSIIYDYLKMQHLNNTHSLSLSTFEI